MAEETPQKPRIGGFTAGLLITFALLCDVLQFLFSFFHVIPWIGNAVAFVVVLFITIVSYVVLGLWFALLRINYFTGKRAALKVLTMLATFSIELIPLLDSLPAMTAGVLTMVIVSRIEDALGTTSPNVAVGRLASANPAQMAGVLGNMASLASPISKAGAVLQFARGAMNGRVPLPQQGQINPNETAVERKAREDKANKDYRTSKFREEIEGFSNSAKQFNVDRIDPSFYGLRTEREQDAYRKWMGRELRVREMVRGKNLDIAKPAEPQPSTFRP